VAEDLIAIRSLLSIGIELSKNRDTIPSIEYANKIWDHQNSFHQWIEEHVGDLVQFGRMDKPSVLDLIRC